MIMRPGRIEHLLRAAANVTGQNKFVLVGSAAVIVRRRKLPADMMVTPEIDIYAPDAEDIEAVSEMIDSNIGQGSRFHDEFGYYGDGVSPATAKMPSDWQTRAIEYQGVECPGIIAIVPEENDVALAKLAAWREKDQDWLSQGVKYKIIFLMSMIGRVDRMPEPNPDRGSPAHEALVERMKILAARCKVDLVIPESLRSNPSSL